MDDVDRLLGENNNGYNKKNKYNNRQYDNNDQSREKNEAYRKINNMLLKIVKDGALFSKYLKIMSRFDKYSVANCMLILNAEPNAIQIKAKQDWNDIGYDTIQGAKSITILEPTRENGVLDYNPKEEYDVSQTNAPYPEEKEHTNRNMLLALFEISKAEREVCDILPSGRKGVEYVASENKLYMCEGLKPEILLQAVVQTIIKKEMQSMEDTEMNEFKTYCISYMICNKYGIDTSKFNFPELPKQMTTKSQNKAIRTELEDIKSRFGEINVKFAEQLEQIEKENKNKERQNAR